MAIYHCSIKSIKRSEGKTATAAAAYRAGEKITDLSTHQTYDYTKRSCVEYTNIIVPDGVKKIDRSTLWNTAEQSENRKNSKTAREIEIALPDELNKEQREQLANDFADAIVSRYNVAADICIHKPTKTGDQRNHHAHILITTREIQLDGTLGNKTRILDDIKTGPKEIIEIRKLWADMVNKSLQKENHQERVDHRSLKEQGSDITPTMHLGKSITYLERQGIETIKGKENKERKENKVATDIQDNATINNSDNKQIKYTDKYNDAKEKVRIMVIEYIKKHNYIEKMKKSLSGQTTKDLIRLKQHYHGDKKMNDMEQEVITSYMFIKEQEKQCCNNKGMIGKIIGKISGEEKKQREIMDDMQKKFEESMSNLLHYIAIKEVYFDRKEIEEKIEMRKAKREEQNRGIMQKEQQKEENSERGR